MQTEDAHYAAKGKHLTLDELAALVAKAYSVGVDGDAPIRVNTSLSGAFSTKQNGLYVTAVFVPVPTRG